MVDIFKPTDARASIDAALKSEDSALLMSRLTALEDKLGEMPADAGATERAGIQLEIARTQVGLDQNAEAWATARPLFQIFAEAEDWDNAVDTCDVLFRSEQDGSLSALGQGIWLAVTFPIDVNLTVAMLEHIIDETPDDADGAAVAATTAAYLVDLRAEGQERDNLAFFANQMLAQVARRHSGVEGQEAFEVWFTKLELDNPDNFLPRLRNVIDVLVQEDWWIDRDDLRSRLPVN